MSATHTTHSRYKLGWELRREDIEWITEGADPTEAAGGEVGKTSGTADV